LTGVLVSGASKKVGTPIDMYFCNH